MSGNSFRNSTHDLRFVFDSALPFAKPALLGGRVVDASKPLARLLEQQVPNLKHSAALEVVAKAVGFQHWHELNTHAQQLIEDFPPDQARPSYELALTRLAPFQRALALFVHVPDAMPPAHEHRAILESTADALSDNGIERTLALRALARMQRADSWNELLARLPIDHPKPLYSFALPRTEQEGGHFDWSLACGELVKEQDALYQGYDDRPASEQRQLEVWVRQTLDRRPDFLEAYLALGTVFEARDETYREAGPVYAQAITRAEALIPKGFKGQGPWIWIENRFYHRLLYAHMSWYAWTGQYPKAVALARKQLRRNKDDNLGIRCLLPSLLVAAGRPDEAHSFAERRLRKDADHDAGYLLALSVGGAAVGDHRAAKRDFLNALVSWPPLRLLPDAQQSHFAYQISSEGAPIERLFKRWLAAPAVIEAETELKRLWESAWPDVRPHQPRMDLIQHWRNESLAKASALS